MSTNIIRIPNEPHVAKVREARRLAGLPVNFLAHPFCGTVHGWHPVIDQRGRTVRRAA